jgi:hypothetical protein
MNKNLNMRNLMNTNIRLFSATRFIIQIATLLTNNRVNRKGFHTLPNPVVPVKVWDNSDKQKLEILVENKGKSGIYM